MRHAVQIGKLRGIPIRVHWSFAIFAAFILVVGIGSGAGAAVGAVIWLVLLFGSVVFHELSHSLVARKRGIAVRDIVLLPIGGVSEIPDLARTPEDEFAIAIAGPLASLVLAAALGIVAVLAGRSLWPPSLSTGGLLVELAWVNVVLAAFNLLPALPMDGGRVLRAVLTRTQGEPRATTIAVRIGKVFAFAMIVVGIFTDIWLVLIGLFVIFGAQSEGRAASASTAMGTLRVGDMPTTRPLLLPAWMAASVAEGYRAPYPWLTVVVVDEQGYLGLVTPERLATAAREVRLGDLADRARLLDPSDPLVPTAFDAFRRTGARELAVGRNGQVFGMLASSTVQSVANRTATTLPG